MQQDIPQEFETGSQQLFAIGKKAPVGQFETHVDDLTVSELIYFHGEEGAVQIVYELVESTQIWQSLSSALEEPCDQSEPGVVQGLEQGMDKQIHPNGLEDLGRTQVETYALCDAIGAEVTPYIK